MSVHRKCPECGAAIPPGSTDGLCTQCLFSLGLDMPDPPTTVSVPPDLGPLLAKTAPAIGVKFHYFGDYELLEEIARGGMGIVFKARQISLNRTVAVKLITAGCLASADAVKRFRLEAEAAARLDHPNIVPIHEVGEHEGHHFFSMKLMEGGSLAEPIVCSSRREEAQTSKLSTVNFQPSTAKPQPPHVGCYDVKESARLLAKVARAVHYAHQRGILHRDLKPGNILIDERGEPHVTDFGLAKLMEADSSLTYSGTVLGTPSYMSPEQAAGKNAELTTASDIWSLGSILYELLTGQPAFRGATPMETLRQVMEEEPKLPSALNSALDRDLETITVKCLEKDPTRRYASAAALADDLEHWMRHEPILARRASVFERVVKWAQRQPVLAAAVVLLIIVMAAGLAGILWQWRHAVLARRAEAAERQRAVRAEASALVLLHEAKLNYVRANRLTGRIGQRFDSLAEIAGTATITNSLGLRNEAIACLVLPDARLLKQWAKTPHWYSFQFDSSHRRYATNDALGNLTIRNAETDAILAQIPGQGAKDIFSFTAFSPDDRFVATVDQAGQTRLWEELTQAPRLLDLPGGTVLLGFTPDSRALAVKRADDSVEFLNLTNGAVEKSFLGSQGLISNLQLNALGEKFLTISNGEVLIRRASDGGHLRTLTPPEGAMNLSRTVWHPDGRRIASAWLHSVGMWDAETGRQLAEFKGHEGPVVGLAFTPSGEYLVSVAWDTTTRFWDSDTGREVLRLPDAGNALTISADARRLSFQSWDHRLVKLYELPDLTAGRRTPLPPPTRHRDHYTVQAVFSPDGVLVAVPDREGIYLFDQARTASVALLPIPGMGSVCFSTDGHALITGGVGAQRWPLKWSADGSELHLGPPEVIEPTRGLPVTWVDSSRDGRSLVVQANHTTQGSYIVLTLRAAPPYEAVRFDKSLRLALSPRISPDGRWVATVPSSFDQIQIWNGHTGKVITNLSTPKGWEPVFSPDGRWLASMERDSMTVWETSDWKVRLRIAHPPGADVKKNGLEFSPDGRILATFSSDWKVRLLRFDTGKELGEFPAGRGTYSVRFTSMGDRFAVANETGYFQLWNLRRVRAQLAVLNLDWDLPPYPPEEPSLTKSSFCVIVHTNAPASTTGEAKETANRQEMVPTSAQVVELRKSIHVREANLPPALIDLSAHYNGSLLKIWGHGVGNDLAALTPGVHRLGGIDYDVRGLIQVRPNHNPGLPREVTGIPINRKCTRLNFLHLTGYVVKSGTKVGAYIIHFKSGQRLEKPILFGHDLDNWWFKPGAPPTEAEIVWTGSNADAERYGEKIRLFHAAWENPWPDEEIASLDMVSSLTHCNPSLIAITAEYLSQSE